MKKLLLSSIVALTLANAYTLINLHPGWQNVGTADDIDVGTYLNRDSIAVVYYYNSLTKSWEVYSPNANILNDIKSKKNIPTLTTIPKFSGFWVYATKNDVIEIDSSSLEVPNILNYSVDELIGDNNTTTTTYNTTYLETKYNLTDEDKKAIQYMWNEEKLAKDVYLTLYNLYQNEPTAKVFYNIATKGETTHENAVAYLAKKYDINITSPDLIGHFDEADLAKYGVGEYVLDEIKNLYDTLVQKGKTSYIDALQVGCMVEVTDINDLDERIEEANASGAMDLVTIFENLRNGSYNHYHAFDTVLKQLGVENGCCSAGDEYCKDYPEGNNGYSNNSYNGYSENAHSENGYRRGK